MGHAETHSSPMAHTRACAAAVVASLGRRFAFDSALQWTEAGGIDLAAPPNSPEPAPLSTLDVAWQSGPSATRPDSSAG